MYNLIPDFTNSQPVDRRIPKPLPHRKAKKLQQGHFWHYKSKLPVQISIISEESYNTPDYYMTLARPFAGKHSTTEKALEMNQLKLLIDDITTP